MISQSPIPSPIVVYLRAYCNTFTGPEFTLPIRPLVIPLQMLRGQQPVFAPRGLSGRNSGRLRQISDVLFRNAFATNKILIVNPMDRIYICGGICTLWVGGSRMAALSNRMTNTSGITIISKTNAIFLIVKRGRSPYLSKICCVLFL